MDSGNQREQLRREYTAERVRCPSAVRARWQAVSLETVDDPDTSERLVTFVLGESDALMALLELHTERSRAGDEPYGHPRLDAQRLGAGSRWAPSVSSNTARVSASVSTGLDIDAGTPSSLAISGALWSPESKSVGTFRPRCFMQW